MPADSREGPIEVLFLCTGNSARSILAEAILNRIGRGRLRGHSAGSFPKGAVNPDALALLRDLDYPTSDLRSKSWDEFAAPGAPAMDVILTVCDAAAGEVCPVWPGRPATAHWGLPDPAAVEGPDATRRAAFRAAYDQLFARLSAFVALPADRLTTAALPSALVEIDSRLQAPA
ncbi:MAG: arsenate reductase ArsC [Inquilinus sp.]|nr:arsenate reductase ArsC [Inquilinus sp.]